MHDRVLKITLVDDDEDDREYFQDAVNEILIDCKLIIYKNGQKVMDDILSGKFEMPDLMFLDLNMPVLSGKRLLAEMRKIKGFENIPIIAIYSTSSSPTDKEETFNLGANAYVSKPNDYNNLKAVIRKVVNIDWKSYTTNENNYEILP